MSIASLFENKDYKTVKWLWEHRCKKHGHRYLVHYSCYLKECNKPERVGMLDIETAGSLNADWGIMLSWAIKFLDENKIVNEYIDPNDVMNPERRDKFLVSNLCTAMKQFDTIIVYYGKDTGGRGQRHDIPFSRTRAVTHGLDFPKAGTLKVIDVYDIIKKKFKLSLRKQEAACKQFGIPYGKHHATPNLWLSAVQGNKKALEYVQLHNVEDVRALERLWKKVCGFYTTRSNI